MALYRVTANVMRVKNTWRYTLSRATAHTPVAAALWEEIDAHTVQLLDRAQSEGLLAPDAQATLVIDTLLRGAGARG